MLPDFKKPLGGQKFKSEELQEAVLSWLCCEAVGEWYEADIKQLITRMQKVIDAPIKIM
jgi:hypothetical protein